MTTDRFKTTEGGAAAAGSRRGAGTASGYGDGVVGPIEIEGVGAVATDQAGDAAAVIDRGRVIASTEIDRLEAAHRQARVERGGAVAGRRKRIDTTSGIKGVAVATTHQAFEAAHSTCDDRRCPNDDATSGGGGGTVKAHRYGFGVARKAEGVSGAATESHHTGDQGVGAADQQGVGAGAEIDRSCDITTAEGDRIVAAATDVGTDARAGGADRQLIAAVTKIDRATNGAVGNRQRVNARASSHGADGTCSSVEAEGVGAVA